MSSVNRTDLLTQQEQETDEIELDGEDLESQQKATNEAD